MPEPISAIVLAGGRSTRLGADKARLALASGEPMLARVVRTLCELTDDIIIAADTEGKYDDLGLAARTIADLVLDRGPAGGLHAGLRTIAHDCAITIACDMPLLNPDLLHALAAHPRGYDALVPRVDGHPQPLHAVYAKACLPALERLLERGAPPLRDLHAQVTTVEFPESEVDRIDPARLSFTNINTPHDAATIR